MAELSLEALAKRIDDLEGKMARRESDYGKDWRLVAGMFTGSDFSRLVDEEARIIREKDRQATQAEFGE